MDRSQLLPTCSTFQSETGGVCDDELDEIDITINTIDDVSESPVIPLALLLRTTPPSGVTAALDGFERMEPLIWESRAAGRPHKKRWAVDGVVVCSRQPLLFRRHRSAHTAAK
jgi:hypothetical protein